jgi:hypothetical protein
LTGLPPGLPLILDLSPEKISAWLKVGYPNNENMPVDHENIYRSYSSRRGR